MQINEFKNTIKAHKGQNLSAMWVRPLKTLKGITAKVNKLTVAVVRGGVDYDNLRSVQEGRADGSLPAENAGLPWGEWAEFPLHITHKGTDYARLYPASGINFIPKTTYFVDGKEVSKETAQGYCLASEFRVNDEVPTCFTIKVDSLVSIG